MLEDNADANWVIDSTSKKTKINNVLTPMSGSVVTTSDAKKKKASGSAKARGKAKAKAKAQAGNNNTPAVPQLPDEDHVHESTVACSVGVRQKLWLDDMLACVNHVCTSVATMGVEAVHITSLKAQLIRTALLFAIKGSIVLETAKATRTHRKWSTCRPALKEHAMMLLIQARFLCCQTSKQHINEYLND